MENPLSSNEVDGNTLLILVSNTDNYHCNECDKDVKESEYNHKRMMCFNCWWDI